MLFLATYQDKIQWLVFYIFHQDHGGVLIKFKLLDHLVVMLQIIAQLFSQTLTCKSDHGIQQTVKLWENHLFIDMTQIHFAMFHSGPVLLK